MNQVSRSVTPIFALLTLLALAPAPAAAQDGSAAPTPESVIGFEPGADYELARFDQVESYFEALAEASDRVRLEQIGTSVQGRPMLLATISSAENLENLEEYREIAARLATDPDLTEEEARSLAERGKAVVWIDGGLHATEVAGAQFPPKFAYRLATEESEEARRIREDVIVLLMPVMNPDGLDIVADWYYEQLGTPFETSGLPTLYHEYVGHDNNRDWFMLTQPESRAVADQLWHRWYPQIVLNHHQTSPFPGRIFIPPFADPVNPNIPAMVTTGINLVGTHM
ncbi:MAG: M14 family zinc carboxypeptidase, partial [Gemmatimonadota bacterium]